MGNRATGQPPKRIPWLFIRLLLYIAAAVFLFSRNLGDHSKGSPSVSLFSSTDSTLSIAGMDLAPGLVRRAADDYREDYPHLRIALEGGGTTAALEALANRRADVAFLNRPPTREEQDLFRAARRDTALWFPVAVGGLVLVRNAGSPVESLSLEQVKDLASDRGLPGVARFYVPDPNLGIWDALNERLGISTRAEKPAQVVYLANEKAVLDAVRDDPSSLGLAGSLSLPDRLDGVALVGMTSAEARQAEAPTDEAVALSRYPLYHYLYVASARYGEIEGSMFVTWITGDRGQRRLERDGYLPARRVLREIRLTTHPLGEGS